MEVHLPERRRRRVRRTVALVLVAVMAAVAAVYVVATRPDDEADIEAVVDEMTPALEAARVPDSGAVEDRKGDQARLAEVVSGMGDLRPDVELSDVEVADDRETATAKLAVSWTVHEGKEPWEYESSLPLRRDGDRWTGQWSPDVLAPQLKDGEGLRTTRLDADRGEILGDRGETVVTERQVYRVGIDRSQVSKKEARRSAKRLAEAVDIDAGPYIDAVDDAGDEAFVEAITYRSGDDELSAVRRRIPSIEGSQATPDRMPLAPTSTFAKDVLGQVGPAIAETIEKSKGRIRAGDMVGQSGLQEKHDDSLRGTSGFEVQAVDLDDETHRSLHRLEPVDGKDLSLSLGIEHQEAAEDVLEAAPKASSLVAIRPSDGAILALANGPGSKGQATATLGRYAPGSTFKVATALALVRGDANPDSRMRCTSTATVDGRSFKNYDDFPAGRTGTVSLTDAIATSCNTALISNHESLSPKDLRSAADSLGITQEPGLGVPAVMGDVPATSAGTETAEAMIGQGQVVATPLAMAAGMASIAEGDRVTPRLVTGAKKAPDPPGQPVTKGEAKQLQGMMRAVVTDGSAPFLDDNPGEPVIAKTGTAEYGSATPPRTHAWMIAAQGDLAVAVFVEDGSGGAGAAGPLVDDFLETVHGEED